MPNDTTNAIPQQLKNENRWVLWRYEYRDEKLTKIPKQYNFQNASSTNEDTWNCYDVILARYNEFKSDINGYDANGSKFNGIGFVLGDTYAGIDLDDCFVNGELEQWAQPIVEMFMDKTYMEVSPSATGLKIFLTVKSVEKLQRTKFSFIGYAVELYNEDRYFTVTANQYGNSNTIAEMQNEFDATYQLVDRMFQEFKNDNANESDISIENADCSSTNWDSVCQLSNEEIIQRIKSREREGKLWKGDISDYGSQSEADFALLGYIACLTKDANEIDSIYRKSGLMRDKWDKKHYANGDTYGQRSVKKILGNQSEQSKQQSTKTAYALTDIGNAEFFSELYGDDLKYVIELKHWIVWDGVRWRMDISGTKAQQKAIRFIKNDLFNYANSIQDNDKRIKALKWALQSQSGTRLEIMLTRASAMLGIYAEQLDTDNYLLNVKNGTIDLRTGELKRHHKTDFITKLAPVEFDANAKCPRFDKYLLTTLPKDMIRYLLVAIGYSLTGDCSEKALFMLWGQKNAGKSTLSDATKYVLGDYGITAQQTVVLQSERGSKSNGEDEANLFGARFVSISEPSENQKWDEAKLKRLVPSNNSRIRARRLYENSFEFAATYKIWLDTNHKPKLRTGTDDAVWSRIKVIPFMNIVADDQQDKHLSEKLKNETSGILNLFLAGLKQWRERGLSYFEPSTMREAVEQYKAENDRFAMFISECVEDKNGAKTVKQHLYNVYKDWHKRNGEYYLMDAMTFGKKMAENGYERDASKRYYLNCDIIPYESAF